MHKIASENQKKFYANRNLMKKPPIFPAISTGFPKKFFYIPGVHFVTFSRDSTKIPIF